MAVFLAQRFLGFINYRLCEGLSLLGNNFKHSDELLQLLDFFILGLNFLHQLNHILWPNLNFSFNGTNLGALMLGQFFESPGFRADKVIFQLLYRSEIYCRVLLSNAHFLLLHLFVFALLLALFSDSLKRL